MARGGVGAGVTLCGVAEVGGGVCLTSPAAMGDRPGVEGGAFWPGANVCILSAASTSSGSSSRSGKKACLYPVGMCRYE